MQVTVSSCSPRPARFSSLAVVCPMANEEDAAVAFVGEVLDHCASFREVRMFVVLDRACRDATRDLLTTMSDTEPRLSVIWAPENRCVVDAYVRGYREALAGGHDWILEIDAGYSHRPAEIARFVEQIETGSWDCVFGSRFCPGGAIVSSSMRRRALSWSGTQLSNALLRTRLRDMTSGFQLFRREALTEILDGGIRSKGHFFQTEMKFRARGLRIVEVPITYSAASPSVRLASMTDALSGLWRLFLERSSVAIADRGSSR